MGALTPKTNQRKTQPTLLLTGEKQILQLLLVENSEIDQSTNKAQMKSLFTMFSNFSQHFKIIVLLFISLWIKQLLIQKCLGFYQSFNPFLEQFLCDYYKQDGLWQNLKTTIVPLSCPSDGLIYNVHPAHFSLWTSSARPPVFVCA